MKFIMLLISLIAFYTIDVFAIGTSDRVLYVEQLDSKNDTVIDILQNLDITGTGYFKFPVGTDAQRPTASTGMTRYNTDQECLELYNSTEWICVGTGGGGGSAGINFVTDPSFESGELLPDATAAGLQSYELYTVDAELYSEFNLQHYQIDWASLSAADAYVRDSFARTGLDDKQGLFSIWIKSTTVSDQDLQLCLRVDDATYTNACDSAYLLTITSDNTWRKYEIPFVFGAASVQYEIFNESYTGALEINVDKIYIGTMPDGYIQDVGQASFIGSSEMNNTSCLWSLTGGTYADFTADSDCTYDTIGSVDEPDTKIPAIKIQNARTDGYYKVIFNGSMQVEYASTTSQCRYALSEDGSNVSGSEIITYANSNKFRGSANNLSYDFRFSSSGEKTIRVIARRSEGGGTCFLYGGGNSASSLFSVYFFPDSSASVVTQQTELTAATANDLEVVVANNGTTATKSTSTYGEWWDSITRNSVGSVTIDYTSLGLSEIPSYDCTAEDGGGTANYGCRVSAISTTTVTLITYDTSNTRRDTNFTFQLGKQENDVNKSQTIVGKFANINDTEICQVIAENNDGDSITANTEDMPWKTELRDNCNAWGNGGNTGSDTNDQYTVQRNSFVIFNFHLQTNANVTAGIDIYVNGTQEKRACTFLSQSVKDCIVADYFSEGDLITFRSTAAITLSANTLRNYISITELPDLSAVVENLSNNPRAARDDQYSETEIPWGKWNGSQLYRRCFTVDIAITATGTVTTWEANLKPKNLVNYTSSQWNFPGSYITSTTDRALLTYDDSNGNIRAVISGTGRQIGAGTSYCMDYVK